MRKEPAWALFATTVMSHLPMLPTAYLFLKRRYVFEATIAVFGLTSSLMYHTCESFNTTIFLDELKWHHLDNIMAITSLGMWCVFICTFKDHEVERGLKYTMLLLTVIIQEKNPWNIIYTFLPITLFLSLPVFNFLIHRRLPVIHYRHFLIATIFMGMAFPFFIAGLDDKADPYRFFHGMWHLLAGISSYFMWIMVQSPGVTGIHHKVHAISIKGDALL